MCLHRICNAKTNNGVAHSSYFICACHCVRRPQTAPPRRRIGTSEQQQVEEAFQEEQVCAGLDLTGHVCCPCHLSAGLDLTEHVCCPCHLSAGLDLTGHVCCPCHLSPPPAPACHSLCIFSRPAKPPTLPKLAYAYRFQLTMLFRNTPPGLAYKAAALFPASGLHSCFRCTSARSVLPHSSPCLPRSMSHR